MSLLPEVERELLRVARRPLTDDAAAIPQAGDRAGRRRPWSVIPAALGLLVALAIAGVFVIALHNGRTLHTAGGGAPNTSNAFPGAPRTQRNGYGVATGACPLEAANRYLPARSGCVIVRRADLAGARQQDLVLLYSRLSARHVSWAGAPASLRRMYLADQSFLRVVPPAGGTVTATVAGTKTAAILAIAHVNGDPGDEVFLQTSQISSGSTAVAYGYQDGRLVPAGVTLAYGGDSADKAGFNCLAGRLLQRTFVLTGRTINSSWRETDVTYAWNGPHLSKIAQRTFTHHGLPPARVADVGAGCVTGVR
jgi:hypothetical protein